ncbi:MAG: thioredoxin family protein [Lentimicrobium sp.]|nr:thioredoxin family protein [Lentimicrobium sp.]
MKTTGILITSIIAFVIATAFIPGNPDLGSDELKINFHTGTWNEALQLAQQQNKPVFLDLSTSWCGYCKRMKANVYTDASVADYYNSTFINVSLDAEKGEGIQLARKYGVRGYPTFVFLNPDGSLAKQSSGYRNPEQFIALAKN